MLSNKAIVRQHIEKIEGVSRTWFEWDWDAPDTRSLALVVEVEFDTDPNSLQFRGVDAIRDTVIAVLREHTTMIVPASGSCRGD